jgi:hypothetical protein
VCFCGVLQIKYNVLNTYQGVISSKLTVNTWQDGAKVKLQFGSEVSPRAQRDASQHIAVWLPRDTLIAPSRVPP